tara:strand:+ start:31803 stop:32177 length:375 start_codon:yes stop_codon:yes gene_type:complete
MELDLIEFIQNLLGDGVKGYLMVKPEGTPYPAFTVEDTTSRGMDLYGNNGKPFDYSHDIQVNLMGGHKFSVINTHKKKLIEALDGFTGVLGSHQVIDCRLENAAFVKTSSKAFECVLLFSISAL